ncbi:unnamed protein product, partial [Prorocentrum cordatum]
DVEEKVEVASMGAGAAGCHRLPLFLLSPTSARPVSSIYRNSRSTAERPASMFIVSLRRAPREAPRGRLRARMRHRDGGRGGLRAGHRPALRGVGGRHGAQPFHEGGPVHLHPDRDGLPRVPRHRRDPHRGAPAVLRV